MVRRDYYLCFTDKETEAQSSSESVVHEVVVKYRRCARFRKYNGGQDRCSPHPQSASGLGERLSITSVKLNVNRMCHPKISHFGVRTVLN